MKKLTLFVSILLMLFLVGCSPGVGVFLTNKYPPLGQYDHVEVYTKAILIPPDMEALGTVSVKDSGFSGRCDSTSVIEEVKNKARKVGGNGVFITEHIKPKGGNSCHQMKGTILRISDFTQVVDGDTISPSSHLQYTVDDVNDKNLLPRSKFSVDLGYGWRTGVMITEGLGDLEDHYRSLNSGLSLRVSFNHYFNNNIGFGFSFFNYHAKDDEDGYRANSMIPVTVSSSSNIMYVGPEFLTRYSPDGKFFFNANLGIGYIGYRLKSELSTTYAKATGHAIGFITDLGAEYKFSKEWGIGLNLTSASGTLSEFELDRNGQKGTVKLEDSNREWLGTMNIMLGVRYYIK